MTARVARAVSGMARAAILGGLGVIQAARRHLTADKDKKPLEAPPRPRKWVSLIAALGGVPEKEYSKRTHGWRAGAAAADPGHLGR